MSLLNAFSDKADEFNREGRRSRSSNPSIVDQAVELFNADTKETKECHGCFGQGVTAGGLRQAGRRDYLQPRGAQLSRSDCH